MPVTPAQIGKRIAVIRKARAMRQLDLARAAHITERTVTEIESGRDAQISTLLKISDALAVEACHLFGRVPPRIPELPA